MVSINLLGGWSVEGDLPGLGPSISHRHQRALLALLAVHLSRPKSREKLCAFLWPERDTAHARSLLNQAIHSLRKVMGDGAIISSGDEIRLDPSLVRSDVDEFERALEVGDRERAIGLHAGPFLDGFFLPEAGELDRWVEDERARLRRRFLEAMEELAEESTARSDTRQALRWWRRLVADDRYSTRLTIGLMNAMERAGDRAGAIRHAGEHARLLAEELEAEPSPEVVALAERMRREPMVRPRRSPGQSLVRARTIREAPSGMPGPDIQRPGTIQRGRDLRWWLAAGVGGATLLGGWFAVRYLAAPHLDPRRVVVAPLENRTGDPDLDVLGHYTADWIIQGLSKIGVHVTTPSATRAALRDIRATGGRDDVVSAGQLAAETGAALVVSGSFYSAGDSLRFHVDITDAHGEPLLPAMGDVSAPETSPSVAVEALRERIAGALGLALNERLSVPTQMTQTPPSYDAYVAYAEGMDLFIDRRWRDAIPYFRRAVELDTGYLVPKLLLALAHNNLGEWHAADTIAASLDRSRDRLGPHDRALLDIELGFLRQDRVATYRAAKRAAEIAPGTLTNVQWAREALGLGRPTEAIKILSALDPTQGEIRGWSSYWCWLTEAYHMLGEHRRELREARRARKLYPTNPTYYLLEARALAALGRVGEVDSVVNEGLSQPFRESGLDPGTLTLRVGDELRVHGHELAALGMYRRSVRWYEGGSGGDPRRESLNRVEALLRAGQLDAADSILTLHRSRHPESLWGAGFDGILACLRGDRARAEKALAVLDSLDYPYLRRGQRLIIEAAINARLGRTPEAVALMRQAFSEGLRYGTGPHAYQWLDSLADDPAFQELMRPRGD